MADGIEQFTFGANPEYDGVSWFGSGVSAEFPTRPEGPTADYAEAFLSFSDTLRDIAGSGTSPGSADFVAAEETTDWSQLLTRTGTFVGNLATTVGDITDAILGRPSSQERAVEAARTQQRSITGGMMPVLLIGGGLLLLLSMGRR